jgi:hypothetical protein
MHQLKKKKRLKSIKTRFNIIQFIKSHKNEEVYYVFVFPSIKHEDLLRKPKRIVNLYLKIGKIKASKLCSNKYKFFYLINDFDIRHFKRGQIVCILLKEFDISCAFKNVIVICKKKKI